MKKVFYLMILIVSFVSCQKNKETILNIEIINNHGDISFSTEKQKLYLRKYSLFEGQKIDSLKIDFNDKNWELINKSFIENKIYSFRNINTDVGEKTNSINLGEKYIITTNQRKIVVKYEYFLDDNEINENKTKRFKNFMKLLNSIIRSKIKNPDV